MFSEVGKYFGQDMLVNLRNGLSPNVVLAYVWYLARSRRNKVDHYGKKRLCIGHIIFVKYSDVITSDTVGKISSTIKMTEISYTTNITF